MITQEQLKDITSRIQKLKSYLEIDKKLIEIANEEEKTVNPNFWNNPKEAEIVMKELRFKKKWVEDFNKTIVLNEEVSVLYEFYKEGEIEENEVIEQYKEIKHKMYNIVHVYDNNGNIWQIYKEHITEYSGIYKKQYGCQFIIKDKLND